MTRQKHVDAIDEWFKGDKKNRGGFVLLGEDTEDGRLSASMASGYNGNTIANLLLFAMEENKPFADIVIDVCEEYQRRKFTEILN